jgi:hypothetical protein
MAKVCAGQRERWVVVPVGAVAESQHCHLIALRSWCKLIVQDFSIFIGGEDNDNDF